MKNEFDIIKTNWESVLEKTKEEFEISDISFNTWIKPLSPLKIEDNTLYISVPEEGYIAYLKKKYEKPLQIIIVENLHIDVEIMFTTSGNVKEKEKKVKEEKKFYELHGLNPLYTFNNFVIGSSNSLAHATSLAVAENIGELHNPLYIFGNSGLGKTHLLHAIAIYVLKNNQDKIVRYTTCENIMEDYTKMIAIGKKSEEFKTKYRDLDVLLIDDIQFLANKKYLQEEFFNFFNYLYENKKQIVVTSDKPPRELTDIEERIITRLAWGVAVDIEPPDYETRIAILRKKEENYGFYHDNEIIKYIASKITTNIRELEGALGLIRAQENLINTKLSLKEAQELLDKTIKEDKNINQKEKITQVVADHFHLLLKDILGDKKTKNLSRPRQIAIYLINLNTHETYKEIGKYFNNRDHSTIIHSIRTINEQLKVDKELQKIIEILREKLK